VNEAEWVARPAPVRIRLAQRFTADGARAIHLLARRVPPGTRLMLDFGEVRDCQDMALRLLARDVASGAALLDFRGLTAHQRVLLGYLGVEIAPPTEADAD